MVELQGELITAREALREQATTDPLTGVATRRTILETLDRELERSLRVGAPCAVVFVDLDHFKGVNDTHGHAAGDAVLRQAAATMRSTLRPYDLIGRYGGEEFVVVLPGCDAAGAQAAAERLRASIAAAAVAVGNATLRVTCSLGVAVGGPGAVSRRSPGRSRCRPVRGQEVRAESSGHGRPGPARTPPRRDRTSGLDTSSVGSATTVAGEVSHRRR